MAFEIDLETSSFSLESKSIDATIHPVHYTNSATITKKYSVKYKTRINLKSYRTDTANHDPIIMSKIDYLGS